MISLKADLLWWVGVNPKTINLPSNLIKCFNRSMFDYREVENGTTNKFRKLVDERCFSIQVKEKSVLEGYYKDIMKHQRSTLYGTNINRLAATCPRIFMWPQLSMIPGGLQIILLIYNQQQYHYPFYHHSRQCLLTLFAFLFRCCYATNALGYFARASLMKDQYPSRIRFCVGFPNAKSLVPSQVDCDNIGLPI